MTTRPPENLMNKVFKDLKEEIFDLVSKKLKDNDIDKHYHCGVVATVSQSLVALCLSEVPEDKREEAKEFTFLNITNLMDVYNKLLND